MATDARSTHSSQRGAAPEGHRLPATGSVLGGRSQGGDSRGEDPTDDLGPGAKMLGPYLLSEKVGEGGMGVVYRGVDREGTAVAVKVLRPHIAHDDSARDRLRREVSTLARVRDDRVAPVLDADIDGPTPYLVTSFVPGPPLDEVVGENGPLSPQQLVHLGRGLAMALGAIHDAGVVHRDLKPGNVLMVGDDPVLIDFGIAHVADDARLTMTGMVMGTPGYLSPEVVEGAPVNDATDWWGWAATLAYAASGQAPFGRGPMPVILDRVTRGQCDLSGVDDRLRPLLESALSPVPSERPSAETVLAQLEEFAAGGRTTGVPVRTSSAREGSPSTQRFGTPAPATAAVAATPHTQKQPVNQPDPTEELSVPPPVAAPVSATPERVRPAQPVSYQQPSVEPAPWQERQPDSRIGQPARSWSLALFGAALLGVAALWPIVALIVLIVWSISARWVDRAMTAMVIRRYNQGTRRTDGLVAVFSSPWHGIRALFATLLAMLLPTFLGAVAGFTTALLISLATNDSPELDSSPPWVVGTLVFIWTMWWGPGGTSMRRGSRSIVRGVLRTEPITMIVLALCGLVAIGGLLWSMQNGFVVDRWPLESMTDWVRGDWIPTLQ